MGATVAPVMTRRRYFLCLVDWLSRPRWAARTILRWVKKRCTPVAEVASLTGLSRQTIIRLFERERGVIVLQRPEAMHKRSCRTIRIPRAVYERVLARLTVR